jgi:hypothetical protein
MIRWLNSISWLLPGGTHSPPWGMEMAGLPYLHPIPAPALPRKPAELFHPPEVRMAMETE